MHIVFVIFSAHSKIFKECIVRVYQALLPVFNAYERYAASNVVGNKFYIREIFFFRRDILKKAQITVVIIHQNRADAQSRPDDLSVFPDHAEFLTGDFAVI